MLRGENVFTMTGGSWSSLGCVDFPNGVEDLEYLRRRVAACPRRPGIFFSYAYVLSHPEVQPLYECSRCTIDIANPVVIYTPLDDRKAHWCLENTKGKFGFYSEYMSGAEYPEWYLFEKEAAAAFFRLRWGGITK